jgi:hypothetical protein
MRLLCPQREGESSTRPAFHPAAGRPHQPSATRNDMNAVAAERERAGRGQLRTFVMPRRIAWRESGRRGRPLPGPVRWSVIFVTPLRRRASSPRSTAADLWRRPRQRHHVSGQEAPGVARPALVHRGTDLPRAVSTTRGKVRVIEPMIEPDPPQPLSIERPPSPVPVARATAAVLPHSASTAQERLQTS